jgi:hypothetical protein
VNKNFKDFVFDENFDEIEIYKRNQPGLKSFFHLRFTLFGIGLLEWRLNYLLKKLGNLLSDEGFLLLLKLGNLLSDEGFLLLLKLGNLLSELLLRL